MARKLTKQDIELRRLVIKYDGNQAQIARIFGVGVTAISNRLNAEKHASWWYAFKRKRAQRKRRERQRRAERAYRERLAEDWRRW